MLRGRWGSERRQRWQSEREGRPQEQRKIPPRCCPTESSQPWADPTVTRPDQPLASVSLHQAQQTASPPCAPCPLPRRESRSRSCRRRRPSRLHSASRRRHLPSRTSHRDRRVPARPQLCCPSVRPLARLPSQPASRRWRPRPLSLVRVGPRVRCALPRARLQLEERRRLQARTPRCRPCASSPGSRV